MLCYWTLFLGVFAKLRKAAVSFAVFVCLCLHGIVSSQWMDFLEIWYLGIFKKFLIQVSLKCDKNNGYFLHEDVCKFMIVSSWILLRFGNVSDKISRENQNTRCSTYSLNASESSVPLIDCIEDTVRMNCLKKHIFCSINFFQK